MLARPSLLVVDDSHAERQLMQLALGEAFPRAEIQTAAHPIIAQQMCAARDYDCVLIDYVMPDMDGLVLAQQLRTEHSYLATVLMTSFGDEMLAAEALRSGVSDYIPKSRITTQSLQRTIGRSIHACSQARLIDEQREEIENFGHALAHDFKQPIRQIITFATLIGKELGDEYAGDVQLHLGYLSAAATRLGRLVDVMAQQTLLNEPPELSTISLSGVIESVKASLEPFLAECGGEIIAPKSAPRAYGNEVLMIQILQNLILNGLRYNKNRAPRVEIAVRQEGEHLFIDVADNGIGIDSLFLIDIFKPLKRLHSAAEYPGAGLGLTLARKAVVAQQGAIWCESTPGRGSVFHVQLQSARGDRKEVEDLRQVRVAGGRHEKRMTPVGQAAVSSTMDDMTSPRRASRTQIR